MKKALLLMSALLLTAMSMTAKGYKITGTLHGDVEGKTVYLCLSGPDQMSMYRPTVIDSTIIRNGQFTFKGKLNGPTLLLLKYFPNDNRGEAENGRAAMRPVLPLFIGNEKVAIEAHVDSMATDFESAFYGTYNYKDAKISGSAINDLYREYKQGFTDYRARNSKLQGDFNQLYYYSKDVVPMTTIVERLNSIDSAKVAEREFLKQFIMRNSDNVVGMIAFSETLSAFDKQGIESLADALSPKLKATDFGKQTLLRADTIKSTATGAMFQDYTLQDANGNDGRLSDYLGKGNYTLLEFWASWCGPCRGSIPHLKQLYGLYHKDGFNILSVSMDTDNKAWHKALGEEKMPWPQLGTRDGFGEIANIYNFNGIPYCVLIGPKGEIVETNCRDARLDRQLARIYGNRFETFHLTGQLDELTDSVTVMTMFYGDWQRNPMEKYALKDGKLDITLKIDKPQSLVLMKPGDYTHSVNFPILPGEYANIEGNMNDYKVTGSYFYDEYAPIAERLNSYTAKISMAQDAYEAQLQELKKNEKKNAKLIESKKEEFVAKRKELYDEMRKEMKEFIINNPRNEACVTLLQVVEPEDMKSVVDKLNNYVKNGRMKPVTDAMLREAENQINAKKAKENIKEGAVAPDFTLQDINGKPLTLSSLRGKYVVLDFWGSWCGWCIKGMPEMKKYYEKYRGKFEIVGVDCNDPVEKWKKAVKDNDLPWLHVYNNAADGTPEKYAVQGYPTKIIINPDGTINKIVIGESKDFYEYLDQLFK
ncbi:MAG: redoxin domain-containing protein [Prevotella sp.]|nr:redoxin domain-containing protein [Prevotella sp.]